MLGMGLTLTVDDFARIARNPFRVLLGVFLQFLIMPILGWSISHACALPTEFAVGLILVSCCPGGTASNVISYLARADVPLSVTMTSVSTIIAIGATPLLTLFYAGSRIEVPAWGLFLSTVEVVLVPVIVGILLNKYIPEFTARILPAAPPIAVLFITLIVASIIGAGRDIILQSGLKLIGAVFSLHVGGFILGYVFSQIIARDILVARTISIEVGMQNSGLGVVLARNNFPNPAFAIPSAISSLFHSLIASALAAWWRKRLPQEKGDYDKK